MAELPYTFKLFWAPLLDRWPIPWPDRRKGWILALQIALVIVMAMMAFLRPGSSQESLPMIGLAAIILAVCSAIQDIVINAYRADLLQEEEPGAGAAAASLGCRAAMLAIGAVGFLLAGRFGWPVAFIGSAGLIAVVSLEKIGGWVVDAVCLALLMSLFDPDFSATQYALLSGVYALSRSLLSVPAGVLAERLGWPPFFLLAALGSLPGFILLVNLAPWHADGPKGAFDPLKDST
ncbi:MAG: MFS transporter [Cyanobium sp.]